LLPSISKVNAFGFEATFGDKEQDTVELLRMFWRPDGVNIDPDNEADLKKKMFENGIDIEKVSIPILLYSDLYNKVR